MESDPVESELSQRLFSLHCQENVLTKTEVGRQIGAFWMFQVTDDSLTGVEEWGDGEKYMHLSEI